MEKRGCMGSLMTWAVSGTAIWITAWLLPGVEVRGLWAAMITALVLGLLNALVRPVMVVFTFPVTVVTLGLFLIVINGVMVWLASAFLDGFAVSGILWAMLASIVITLVTTVLDRVIFRDSKRHRD